MRSLLLLCGLCCASSVLAADEPALRPSARLLFKQPELARPGACVEYREGGAGWLFTEPTFFLRGRVSASQVVTRRLGRCPEVPGKSIEQYSRAEVVRLAEAYPCVSRDDLVREEQLGLVSLSVTDWETPWAKKAANAGRLYQGGFLDRPLHQGMLLELEADLLSACSD